MSRRKGRGPTPPKQWVEMRPAAYIPPADPELARLHLESRGGEPPELWKNDRYTVAVERYDDSQDVRYLSIRRNDRKAAHDWRDFQRIKNDIAGVEAEAVELYPAESRLMDTANQYHLWVMPRGVRWPIGFDIPRTVSGAAEATPYGAAQRDPDDQGATTPC